MLHRYTYHPRQLLSSSVPSLCCCNTFASRGESHRRIRIIAPMQVQTVKSTVTQTVLTHGEPRRRPCVGVEEVSCAQIKDGNSPCTISISDFSPRNSNNDHRIYSTRPRRASLITRQVTLAIDSCSQLRFTTWIIYQSRQPGQKHSIALPLSRRPIFTIYPTSDPTTHYATKRFGCI